MTYKEFYDKWKQCYDCGLGASATHHVIGTGSVPADVLIIGENPGAYEDHIGEPFVGKAGHLLIQMLKDAHQQSHIKPGSLRLYFTNLVACRPVHPAVRELPARSRPPERSEVIRCSPRLHQLTMILQPAALIFLGASTQVNGRLILSNLINNTNHHKSINMILDLPHPSSILRRGGQHAGDYQSCTTKLSIFLQQVELLLVSHTIIED